MNLSDKNKFTKVIVEDIVFLQGEDYNHFTEQKELHEEIGIFDKYEYLLQWWPSGRGFVRKYDSSSINTPFLGDLVKIPGYIGYFLFVENTKTGYIGLSKIVRFEHPEPREKHWSDTFTRLLNVRAK